MNPYDADEAQSLLTNAPNGPSTRLLSWWIALVLVIAIGFLPTDFVALGPGPAPEVEKLVEIEARTYSSQGSIRMTTATVTRPGGVKTWQALIARLRPDISVIPEEQVYPANQTEQQASEVQAQAMTESQQSAALAALRELNIEVPSNGALIGSILKSAPASKFLDPGDVVVAVDGVVIKEPKDLAPVVETRTPGAPIKVAVLRDGSTKEVAFASIESPDPKKKGKAAIGISVTANVALPFKISVDAGEIGGPSAGLVFALTMYDMLEPTDLTGGRIVAGTGTITPDGEVGAVGAVIQKVKGAERAGATIFLVPRDEYRLARKAAKRSVKVIPVGTLHEAIEALRRAR